ncbi:MAG: putative 2-aminoethylphosphonate ABC transporter permease subunit [Treponema sp.]|nr:putative 2-aminoethylphosphonate ABC transporter permease subunit [Treponema sp.]
MQCLTIIDVIKRRFVRFNTAQLGLLLFVLGVFTVVFVFPLGTLFSKAFTGDSGKFIGLDNYRRYFSTPSLSVSVWNTVFISLVATAISSVFGFLYAYAITRTAIPGKALFKYAALFPIFIPTVVHALGLVYIFGRQGFITRLGFNISLYGRNGIIISEIIYTFPQAYLLFFVALEYADGRLYEACTAMGIWPFQQFLNVTLPEIKYTIINTLFVCFTLAFTDFGAPKVIGGSYNVLATDIYKQIAGQFNMNMGAVVGTLLLIPAIISFITGRFVSSKNAGTLNSKTIPLTVKKNHVRDTLFFLFCALVTLFFVLLAASLFIGAFSMYYPYNLDFTLKHFIFNESTGGIGSFLHSIYMSLFTAVFGTAFVFLYAYMMEKTERLGLLTRYGKLLALLPLAVPGMVVGISFVFFFNARNNPLNFMYGTMTILILSNIIHYFSVPYLSTTGALKKLDREFENVAESMKIPRWRTFFRVSVPLSFHAIVETAMYFFVNSMVTVSALVFLYSAHFKIASIAITHMEEAGDISQAAAMSLLILFINVTMRVLYEFAVKINKQKHTKKEKI